MDLFLSLPIKYRNTMKVRCKIFDNTKAKFKEVTLIVDTGASTTSLAKNLIAGRLGYTSFTKGATKKRTATGLQYFDTTTLSRIEIGGEFAFSDIPIDILDWEDSSFAGVIGMDILSQLHFHSDTQILRIQNKPFNFEEEQSKLTPVNFMPGRKKQ